MVPEVPSGEDPQRSLQENSGRKPRTKPGILKPPKLDRYIQTMLPQEAIKSR